MQDTVYDYRAAHGEFSKLRIGGFTDYPNENTLHGPELTDKLVAAIGGSEDEITVVIGAYDHDKKIAASTADPRLLAMFANNYDEDDDEVDISGGVEDEDDDEVDDVELIEINGGVEDDIVEDDDEFGLELY